MTHFETRSGFVSVVGRPNVGKSTLVNAIVGQKVAITSARPQTTRNTIRGVVTLADDSAQIVLVDTPGIHKPRTALGERLNTLVYGSLADSDAALFVIDATQPIGPGDRLIAERLLRADAPVVLAVNKVDIADKEEILTQLAEAGGWDFEAYVPISARKHDGIDLVVTELVALLPPGPFFFPPEAHSDQPDSFLAGEIIREKYLARLREELPHSLGVAVDEMETDDSGLLRISATAYVERDSQKGMAIGKGGSMIKAVGTDAREDLERLFGTKVFLSLRVKVEKDWQRSDELLDRLGF
ncbi:MAG: GTPase Era [Acidimicrobiia bacterium]|nr:MAG: GTPase Era [Acidimicrobiia bacterium]